jgi:hypothetical protein
MADIIAAQICVETPLRICILKAIRAETSRDSVGSFIAASSLKARLAGRFTFARDSKCLFTNNFYTSNLTLPFADRSSGCFAMSGTTNSLWHRYQSYQQ